MNFYGKFFNCFNFRKHKMKRLKQSLKNAKSALQMTNVIKISRRKRKVLSRVPGSLRFLLKTIPLQ